MESSSSSYLLDGDTKKEHFMTTTVRGGVRERIAEEQGGAEQERPFESIYPLVLAALAARREEGGGIQHPLVLAALMARREERDGISPLLLAALMARREEREKETV
jgi:hypothetical protein